MRLPILFEYRTFLSDIHYIKQEYNLLRYIYKYCKINNILNECSYELDITDELNNGLIRPYFIDFIKKHKNIYVFNGKYMDDDQVFYIKILELIEKHYNIKFNIIKDISTLNHLKQLSIKIFVPRNNYFIDIPSNKQIPCLYNKNYYYDIYKKIIQKYNIDLEVFNNKEILDYCSNNYIFFYNENGSIYQRNKHLQELTYMNFYRFYELTNKNADNDTYFRDLKTLPNNL
jgi:hypothetical protein